MTKTKTKPKPTITASTERQQKPHAGSKNLIPFKPGQSGNPAGRAVGSRNKFSEAMVSDFLEDWHQHGSDVLARVREVDPAAYLRVAAVLVPKELSVSVDQKVPGGLDPDEWQILRRIIDLVKANAPGGDLSSTLETIESALRADQAKLIE